MLTKTKLTATLLAAMLLGGCAPKNWDAEEDGAYDELEPINRETFKINGAIDTLVLKPVARSYQFLTPPPVQKAVGNVFDNLLEPTNMANNVLQKQGDATVDSFARFMFNTTIGLGGIFDVADKMGVREHKADFGQTLRAYGLSNTTYIFLPLLGPSTLADSVGSAVDSTTYPPTYLDDKNKAIVYGIGGVHKRAEYLDATDLVEGAALDEYSFIRDAYEEQRQADVPSDVWRF